MRYQSVKKETPKSKNLLSFVRILVQTVITAAIVLQCTACANPLTLPSSGGIDSFAQRELEQHRVFSNPAGPLKDATPEEIVRGFINAMPAGVQSGEFTVAQSFLTARAGKKWNPLAKTQIFQDDLHYERIAQPVSTAGEKSKYGAAITVKMNTNGQLDCHGIYSAVSSDFGDNGANNSIIFKLGKVDGQWRISSLPAGVFISHTDFEQVYRQVSLYEISRDRKSTIIDNRWFGLGNWRTSAVASLIQGPAGWLRGSVVSLGLEDVKVISVDVSGAANTVKITLSKQLSEVSEEARALLVRMLRLTFGEGDRNASISISTDSGEDYSQADSGIFSLATNSERSIYSLSSAGYVLRLEASTFLRIGKVDQSSGILGFVFSQEGGALLTADGQIQCLNESAQSCSRSWGDIKASAVTAGINGEIWAVSSDRKSINVLTPHGQINSGSKNKPLALPISGASIDDIALSPEGYRIVAAVSGKRESGIFMCSIVRDTDGKASGVGSQCQRVSARRNIQSVTFYNDTAVVYANDDAQRVQAYSQIGPGPEDRLSLYDSQITSLTAGQVSSTQKLAVLTKSGQVYAVGGSLSGRWSVVDTQAVALGSN